MRMHSTLKHLNVIGMGLAATFVALNASAQNMGSSGDVVFSLDRGFGFYAAEHDFEEPNGNSREVDYTDATFGWGLHSSPMRATRFSLDVYVIDQLSVGGSLGFAHINDQDDDDGRGGVIFAPRVGYFIPFNDQWGFWPRGGLAFYNLDDPDHHQVALYLEGMFSFSPGGQFGFVGGPIMDLGMTGEIGNNDYTERAFGLAFGMFGWI